MANNADQKALHADSQIEKAKDLSERIEATAKVVIPIYFPDCPIEVRERIVAGTIELTLQHLSNVRSSFAGYARSVLLSKICDELLVLARVGDRRSLNNLMVLLRLKLKEDSAFYEQIQTGRLDDDLLQDASLILLEKLQSKLETNPYLYFKTIILFKLKEKHRTSQVTFERFADLDRKDTSEEEELKGIERLASGNELDQEFEKRDLIEKILQAVNSLSGFCKEYFKALYRESDDREWRKQTREKWELNESAFNIRIHRCRHGLQELLQARGIVPQS